MKKRITIKDIATRAQVSTGTVDRVLHNRGNVAPEVKKRIQQAIDELGYQKNILASTLAFNRIIDVVALIPTSEDSYWKQIHTGIQKALKTVQNYGMAVHSIHFNYFDPKNYFECAQQVIEKKPDAILFPPMFS